MTAGRKSQDNSVEVPIKLEDCVLVHKNLFAPIPWDAYLDSSSSFVLLLEFEKGKTKRVFINCESVLEGDIPTLITKTFHNGGLNFYLGLEGHKSSPFNLAEFVSYAKKTIANNNRDSSTVRADDSDNRKNGIFAELSKKLYGERN